MQGQAMSAAAAAAGETAYGVDIKPRFGAGVQLAYTHDGAAIFKQNPEPAPAYQTPPANSASAPAYQTPPASSAPPPLPVGRNGGAPLPIAISSSADSHKRKRGLPRKYASTAPLAVVPPSLPAGAAAASATPPALPRGSSLGLGSGGVASPPVLPAPQATSEGARQLAPKKRGRPLGSADKKLRQAATAGSGRTGLKPSVITVQVGEDVASKVMAFSQNGWAVCTLAANGSVSTMTLRQAASSGATVTYEGHFEILSLSGSYLLSESNGLSSRTGGLNVSLAGPDGRVLGGTVAGPLTASSPVQVVIGSFVADGKKEPKQDVVAGIPGHSRC